jgi:hypothetical protein
MWLTSQRFWRALSGMNRRKTARRARVWTCRPQLEALEDRTLLSAYVVTTTADSGPGSLRDAITQVNADTNHTLYASPSNPNVDEIDFNITAASDAAGGGTGYNATTGVATIKPQTAVPTITNSVIIDGYTQSGASPNTLLGVGSLGVAPGQASQDGDNAVLKIDLYGSQAGTTAVGLDVNAPQSVVRGLDVTNWGSYGILLDTNGNNSTVAGNFIGTDVTGEHPMPNGYGPLNQAVPSDATVPGGMDNGGIRVNSADNLIGGADAASRNILSGNVGDGIVLFEASVYFNPQAPATVFGNQVEGNFIGTDATGTQALANVDEGPASPGTGTGLVVEYTGGHNTIGGTAPGAGNLISGNQSAGIYGGNEPDDAIEGNFFGTNVTGTTALPNGTNDGGSGRMAGVIETMENTQSLLVAGNLISGNERNGIQYYGPVNPGPNSILVQGNFIGTDVTGTATLGIQQVGVYVLRNALGAIGGTTAAERNIISGNGYAGIEYGGAPGLQTEGNYIGTDVTGTSAVPNYYGIAIQGSGGATIGGTVAGAGNVVSGNTDNGIFDQSPGNNTFEGNLIGTNAAGTAALGNGDRGIAISGANNDAIGGTGAGAGNVIAFSHFDGITVYSGTGNAILGNSIHDNGGLGIYLNSANNANDNQAAPVLTTATTSATSTTVSGTLASVANTTFRIEFFANQSPNPSGFGEGQTYLGFTTVTTDGNGNATFTASGLAPAPADQGYLSATATNQTTNNTSEFSKDRELAVATLTSSASPSVFGQPVSFTANLSAFAGSGTPTGSVDFVDTTTNTDLGSVTLSGGTATLTTSALAVGTHVIQAVYGGDGTFLSTSATLTQTVNQDATTTALSSSPNPSTYSQGVTLTATVSANAPGSGTPTGSVDFVDTTTNTDLGSVALSGGAATLNVSTLAAGSHAITATYSGDSNFLSSASPTDTQTVHSAATTTSAVSLSSSAAVYGQPVTLTATVTNTQTSAPPAGNVTFYDGATVLGTVSVDGSGSAALTVSTLAVGKHSLTASFSDPAGNFAASGSPKAASLIVSKANTTTALTATTNSPVFGQSVTFTATVTPVAPSGATPMGSVTFKDGSTVLKTVTLSGGSASFTTSKLAVGNHSITVAYNGNADFLTSSSTANSVTVSPDGTTASVIVTAPASTPVFGQSVTLKATVTASAPGSGTPTGTVTFYDGTVALGTATLSNGVASLKTTALSVGANSITVSYSGDSNFLSSTSGSLALTVNPDSSTTKLTSSSSSATVGQPVTFTATVSAASPGSGTPTGTVSFYDGSTLIGTVSLSSGVAQLTYSFPATGKHKIKAVYNGDSDFLTSTSGVLTETIS